MTTNGSGSGVKLGVLGAKRGMSFTDSGLAAAGLELAALCDSNETVLRVQGRKLGVAQFTDFDAMLASDIDAVVVANYFHEHAPFAIRALRAGKHVLSECVACHTLAEGVALVRAVEETGKIYMIAENYPYSRINREMRRLFEAGEIGPFRYGEGEYTYFNRGGSGGLAPALDHWRNWMPATYYCTHSMAPIMMVTGTRPVQATGFVTPYLEGDFDPEARVQVSDNIGMIVCRMDNGAYVKTLQGGLSGGHGCRYRIHGNKGVLEHSMIDLNLLRVHRDGKDENDPHKPCRSFYWPNFSEHDEAASKTGHGGGDYFTLLDFGRAIAAGEQPFLDVYRGVDMSIIGVLAYRSALQGSVPLDVPDFHDPAMQAKYEQDDWTPDPHQRKPGQPWPSIEGEITPTPAAVANAEALYAKLRDKWENLAQTQRTP